MGARSTQAEPSVQRTLFNVLNKNKASAIVPIDSGENEKSKSR